MITKIIQVYMGPKETGLNFKGDLRKQVYMRPKETGLLEKWKQDLKPELSGM